MQARAAAPRQRRAAAAAPPRRDTIHIIVSLRSYATPTTDDADAQQMPPEMHTTYRYYHEPDDIQPTRHDLDSAAVTSRERDTSEAF